MTVSGTRLKMLSSLLAMVLAESPGFSRTLNTHLGLGHRPISASEQPYCGREGFSTKLDSGAAPETQRQLSVWLKPWRLAGRRMPSKSVINWRSMAGNS